MANMAAEPVCLRTTGSDAPFSPKWKASILCKLRNYPPSSTIRASQSMDDKNKAFKELGMFSLKKKIEDTVLRAEMLAPAALELEEARLHQGGKEDT
ncbi:hypothetical protein F0562_015550 [Nyssa sinensis]|uniref:Uncharacterized protein n=1 Tax=Nyssa sinensis TaxID=561372 RepID=A0A5J4ZKH9_9ASTE|nr:hypothetical protein F0562_015550 [Nyssa sinensis]